MWIIAIWQAGFAAKGRINGGVYNLSSYRARDTATDQDVSNTEGITGNITVSAAGAGGSIAPECESRMAGLQHMEAEVRNATFATDLNPFATPVGPPNNVFSAGARFNVSNFIILQIFVNGLGGVSWFSPSFLVLDGSQDMDIQRLQPVTFTGRSDGWYHSPWM